MPNLRVMVIETTESVVYDADRVKALYDELRPEPDLYGDAPAYAVYAYLRDSMYGADVFESQGDYGQWPTKDAPYDPTA